jgi:hypothetical protein
MYRIGSSPGAEGALVTMRDAGVDRSSKCFVMVLQTPGFQSLATAIRSGEVDELADRGPASRREIWRMLRRIADGLRILHEQRMIHRDVRAENLLIDPSIGLSSVRLGGFEWSIRLDTAAAEKAPVTWSTPPERLAGEGTIRLEDDWFGFGIVAARCLLDLENHANNSPAERLESTWRAVARATARQLGEMERGLIARLISKVPRDRLTQARELDRLIDDLRVALDENRVAREDAPLLLAFDQRQSALINAAREAGFAPSAEDPLKAYNPLDPEHVASLARWLRRDFFGAELHTFARRRRTQHLLVGQRLTIRIGQFVVRDRATRTETLTWRAVRSQGPATLALGENEPAARLRVPGARLSVVAESDLARSPRRLQEAGSWDAFLPELDESDGLRADLARFHEFVRCTNQIELLMRDAEIFAYRVVSRSSTDGVDQLVLEEVPRARPPVDFARTQGMARFLEQELETGKHRAELVILGDVNSDTLTLSRVEETEHWRVTAIDHDEHRVTVERATHGGFPPTPSDGLLRTHGFFGQIRLIRRRKKAIDKLNGHAYLLRSLSEPGHVYMDTGDARLGVTLPVNAVDTPKRAAIEDILRVRPIYALQGPPGTGKTTLVAWLVREILDDDPVAQILVTAQAHGAVDVLRDKVATEAYHGVADEQKPLAVRLRRSEPVDDEDTPSELEPDSVEGVALSILQGVLERLPVGEVMSPVQREWRAAAGEMADALRTRATLGAAPDFCELVKRGSHLIYCTTSAGELEALADMTLSFDWSILEEAGKAHGFDLALPLQAGHRWLLIGDQFQLPPYRYDDYAKATGNLEGVVQALLALPDRGGGLVDFEWAIAWRDRTVEEKAAFADFVASWLKTFARVFDECRRASGEDRLTAGEPNGSAAGRITGQHRMHPTIGQLISDTYYESAIESKTLLSDGSVRPDVVHPFVGPGEIAGRAIVWLDLLPVWAGGAGEVGPRHGKQRYTNPTEINALARFLQALRWDESREAELDLAVLSPYTQQVHLLRRELGKHVPEQFILKAARRRDVIKGAPVAHTVDSFQGNQAKVIAVSLVRNNHEPPGEGLGFLRDAARMNVLLSRAECLLVLVGSFDFFVRQVAVADPEDRNDPLWHLRTVTDLLAGWFEEGRALRLPASEIPRR